MASRSSDTKWQGIYLFECESTLHRNFIRLQQENKERSESLRHQQLLQEQQLWEGRSTNADYWPRDRNILSSRRSRGRRKKEQRTQQRHEQEMRRQQEHKQGRHEQEDKRCIEEMDRQRKEEDKHWLAEDEKRRNDHE
ncbi:hypothetical protein GBF38_021784 [Nibea albiflora]|uniref:Uncharacterized protein n=1 Tax=Nibea albiflora TaxID=240163 RepID=A0ACB7FHF2_NIBAL|nr:hypothetical protein GBF38_021784 [Nibea albiflora]